MNSTLSSSSRIPQFLRDFLAEPWEAVLATQGPDGHSQQTIMWYDLEGDDVLMTCLKNRVKVRNLLKDPRASITIVGAGCYATLVGRIGVEYDKEAAQTALARLVQRYSPGGVDDLVQKLTDDRRVVLRFQKTRHYSHRVKSWLAGRSLITPHQRLGSHVGSGTTHNTK